MMVFLTLTPKISSIVVKYTRYNIQREYFKCGYIDESIKLRNYNRSHFQLPFHLLVIIMVKKIIYFSS